MDPPLSTEDRRDSGLVKRSVSHPSDSFGEKAPLDVPTFAKDSGDVDAEQERRKALHAKLRPIILAGLVTVILGWWISATILKATRHRWIVQTIFAWAFILIIAFRFIPNSVISKPVAAVWIPLVQIPFYRLPYYTRLSLGWLCLLGIIFGSAFGFKLQIDTNYGYRAVSVLGLAVFQFCFWLSSTRRSEIPWPTVIVGLFMQQAIALFVLKTDAGFSIFNWIATLASDFLTQANAGSGFFFDAETIAKHWFFVNTVSVIAASSPWVGMGESACLVRPYVDLMTESELHLAMTSGFSTIAGSVLTAYINLGVPARNLITSSVMSIPASIAISKMRIPETQDPVTRGRVIVDRGDEGKSKPANALHAFSKGAIFGVIVAGQILANVLTVLALVATINGLLTWIGRGFGIHHLTLELILGYVFYPVAFFLGVPRPEILRVSQLLATKLIANEFVAYTTLQSIVQSENPLSPRAYTITSYALCGFANLGSLGIQIGVLSALAPSQSKVIARIAPSAMICGFISTLQTAGIVGMLV